MINYKNAFYEQGKQITSINELLKMVEADYKDLIAIKYPIANGAVAKTYQEFVLDVKRVACYLNENGIVDERIALIGKTTYDYLVTYLAIVCSGNTVIPIDKDFAEDDYKNLIRESRARYVVCDYSYVSAIQKEQEEIRSFFILDFTDCQQSEKNLMPCVPEILENYCRYSDLNTCDPDKEAVIIYTSGTTGKSKGVILSQKNITTDVTAARRVLGLGTGDRSLSILPLFHMYEMSCDILLMLCFGGTIVLNDSIRKMRTNLKLFQPTIIFCVPLILQSLQKLMQQTPQEMNPLDELGGKLKRIVCGGAFLDQSVIDFFDEYGITVVQGYGITECSPLIAANPDRCRKDNSIGKVVECCKVKIAYEEKYDKFNEHKIGEILVKGTNVMIGYDRDEKANQEAFVDGWFRTGDIGYLDEDDYLFITGRIKNLIILNNGKNVSAELLEERLMAFDIIEEVIVKQISEAGEERICAEIYPSAEYIKENQILEVKEEINKSIRELNQTLPMYMQICSIHIREQSFERTATNKIKRL